MSEPKIIIDCAYDEMIPIHKLVPHPRNNNKHPQEQLDWFAKVLSQRGTWRYPIVVSKLSGFIISGHGRLMVAEIIGMKEVPVDYQEFENEAAEVQQLTFDNEIARHATLDEEKVKEQMAEFNLTAFDLGIQEIPVEIINEGLTDEDAVPEVINPITKRGDVWLLGEHRVLCGDSTMIDEVEKLMDGENADMVFTDPPYGMSLDADYSKMGSATIKPGKKHDNIISDSGDFDPSFIFSDFFNCKDIVLFGADYYCENIPSKNDGSWLIWDKRVEDRYDKIIGSAFETIWSKRKVKRQIIRHEYVSWDSRMEDKVDGKKPHPTMKPVKLLEKLLEIFKAEFMVDPFLGSGSTLIACEKTNRKCYGMELDEKYCDVIIKRWEEFTGKKATLESSGQIYAELQESRLNIGG